MRIGEEISRWSFGGIFGWVLECIAEWNSGWITVRILVVLSRVVYEPGKETRRNPEKSFKPRWIYSRIYKWVELWTYKRLGRGIVLMKLLEVLLKTINLGTPVGFFVWLSEKKTSVRKSLWVKGKNV